MERVLSFPEVRVLGCLLEKEATTPDYYPLTLNSLVAACNQKSNRDPVTDFEEETVAEALQGLRGKRLALEVRLAGSRAAKFQHGFNNVFDLTEKERALICVLMLRGPQTAGELRARSERLFLFKDLEEVNETLKDLAGLSDPMVRALPRQPGRKEIRHSHLLGGEPSDPPPAEKLSPPEFGIVSSPPAPSRENPMDEEIKSLKEELAGLKLELKTLSEEFSTFKRQFE